MRPLRYIVDSIGSAMYCIATIIFGLTLLPVPELCESTTKLASLKSIIKWPHKTSRHPNGPFGIASIITEYWVFPIPRRIELYRNSADDDSDIKREVAVVLSTKVNCLRRLGNFVSR